MENKKDDKVEIQNFSTKSNDYIYICNIYEIIYYFISDNKRDNLICGRHWMETLFYFIGIMKPFSSQVGSKLVHVRFRNQVK